MNTTIRNLIAATTAAAALAVPVSAVALSTTSTPAASADTTATTAASASTSETASTERPTYSSSTSSGTTAGMVHRYGETAQANGTSSWSSMYEFMEFAITDVGAYWASEFAAAGYTAPHVSYRFMESGESAPNACKSTTGDRDAFYCPTDDTIYVSQQMMADLWNGSFVGPGGKTVTFGGDFAVAGVLAHEFAHNLQAELGLLETHTSVQFERHADCLAGIWTRSAESRHLLDPGDIEEGLQAMWQMGDVRTASEGQTHGSATQRQEAFTLGYQTGSGASCDTILNS